MLQHLRNNELVNHLRLYLTITITIATVERHFQLLEDRISTWVESYLSSSSSLTTWWSSTRKTDDLDQTHGSGIYLRPIYLSTWWLHIWPGFNDKFSVLVVSFLEVKAKVLMQFRLRIRARILYLAGTPIHNRQLIFKRTRVPSLMYTIKY